MDGWMNGWMDGWMDGLVGGWVGGYVDGWMEGWMDGKNGWMVYMYGSKGEIRRWVIEGGSGGYGFQKNVEMP